MKEKAQNIAWIPFIVLIATLILVLFQELEYRKQKSTLDTPVVDYWEKFAQIKKERKYIEEASAYYRIPVFTEELKALSGKEVILRGYYLPYSRLDSVIIISRYPNASCFFCGLAGVESVAMVEIDQEDPQYKMDQMLTVRGKLTLNSTDINKLAFVLEDALVGEE